MSILLPQQWFLGSHLVRMRSAQQGSQRGVECDTHTSTAPCRSRQPPLNASAQTRGSRLREGVGKIVAAALVVFSMGEAVWEELRAGPA